MSIINLSGVEKRFGKNKVLKGMDLSVEEGDILGLIGENGVGKTTTTKIILGLEHAQKGAAEILGANCSDDIGELRKEIGYVSETAFTPDYLTVADTIKFHKQFYPSWDEAYSQDLLTKLNFKPDQRVSTLSRGQNARLKLLLAFAHRPKLLIIDEITAGLDALARHDLVIHLKELISTGKGTILFATNLLYDLEKLATKIAFIDNGVISFVASVNEMMSRFLKITFGAAEAISSIPQEMLVDKVFDEQGAHAIIESNNKELVLNDERVKNNNPKFSPLNLEDTFVYLVKRQKGVL